ncbi:MAG: response regulator [Candidatus Flexifilum sp.]|jgi:CheY-like chemotaxis protein
MPKTALIIDDNPANSKVLAQLLARSGVGSIEVNDPRRLDLSQFTPGSVDVVFLDLEMPAISGYELLGQLRAALGAVPIIACTVHISEINVTRELGFDGFLGKPLDHDRFPTQLANILSGQPVWERI